MLIQNFIILKESQANTEFYHFKRKSGKLFNIIRQ